MPTRAELRTMLRRRLEDTTGTPLWDDATLNDFLGNAIAHYGIRLPAEDTITLVVPDGATTLPVAPYLESREIVAVRDAAGRTVPHHRTWTSESDFALAQGWRWWNGALLLSRPAAEGSWEVDYLSRRQPPSNDIDALDIRPGDEEIVVLLSASNALLRRAVELGKRGAESAGLTLTRVAEHHGRDAEHLIATRRRRATGGWMDGR